MQCHEIKCGFIVLYYGVMPNCSFHVSGSPFNTCCLFVWGGGGEAGGWGGLISELYSGNRNVTTKSSPTVAYDLVIIKISLLFAIRLVN